jgi:hypothetical protein
MYLTVPEGMSGSLKFTDMRMPTQTLTVYDADQETIILEANCIKEYATLAAAAKDGNTTDAEVAYNSQFFSSGQLILGAGYHQFYIRMVARVPDVYEVGLSARVDISEWLAASCASQPCGSPRARCSAVNCACMHELACLLCMHELACMLCMLEPLTVGGSPICEANRQC